tara:strand:- start:2565 stop:4001 length:1437 start_codon:yes stop_codon:yes gene_type:complete
MPLISTSYILGNTSRDAQIMTHVRKPKFVDNAVHLAEINPQNSDKHKLTIRQRKTSTYAIATGKAYQIQGRQDSVKILEPDVAGHDSTSPVFYMSSQLSSSGAKDKPPLIYNSVEPSQRLFLSDIQTSTDGTIMTLKNLKGKTIEEIGFIGTSGHFAQPVDVGLRTSDLAMRLAKDVADEFTSVNLGLSRNPTNANTERRKFSTKFVSHDFHDINLLTAFKFLGRYDNCIAYFDRFGNLLYVPFNFTEAGRMIDSAVRTGGKGINPIANTPNKIAVQGVPIALNNVSYVIMSDGERQSGRGGDIQEEPSVITDASVKSNDAARRIARTILKANNILEGSMYSDGHPNAWDLRPGQIITYEGLPRILTEVSHNLSNNSTNLVFLQVDTGVEGILQGLVQGISVTEGKPDVIQQVVEDSTSLFGDIKLVSKLFVIKYNHGVAGDGFIIGKSGGRGLIGGSSSSETIKGSKSLAAIYGGDE